MKQQHKTQSIRNATQGNELGTISFADYFQPYPFNFYSPFWSVPYYGFSDQHSMNKLSVVRCNNCKIVSSTSIMTQTPDNFDVQLSSKQSAKLFSQQLKQKNPSLQQIAINSFLLKQEIQDSEQLIKLNINQDNQIQSNISKSVKIDQQFQLEDAPSKPHNQEIRQIILDKMLKCFSIAPEAYEALIDPLCKGNSLQSQIVKYFHQKINSFKKSKQQMIKLIIRKTQRHYKVQNNCKRDQRFKKFGGYKSMNSIYLEKLFSDPNFVKSYNAVIKNFLQQFQSENSDKLNSFADKAYSAQNSSQLKVALKILDQKNKMPWPAFWVQKLKKVIMELKTNYINHTNIEQLQSKIKKRIKTD